MSHAVRVFAHVPATNPSAVLLSFLSRYAFFALKTLSPASRSPPAFQRPFAPHVCMLPFPLDYNAIF